MAGDNNIVRVGHVALTLVLGVSRNGKGKKTACWHLTSPEAQLVKL